MAINFSVLEDEAGLDSIISNARIRASRVPITVRSVTFPANPNGTNWISGTGTPISLTSGSAFALDAGQILTGIITLKPTASVNLTFDTAAQIVAGVNQISSGAEVGDVIEFTVINGASATFTLTPVAGGGITFDPNQANTTILAASSRYFMLRITNVTPGSEAAVLYW